ncbi:MAG: protein translocase subunit SecF [Betaproteobacteria bacterium]|nr:protein translocase subunit SecF [Betaproteobacteria bacterium]
MEFFRIKRVIPFMRYALWFNVASIAMFVIAVTSLATKGLNLGVDFTGGTVMEVQYAQAADLNKIRDATAKLGFTEASVQTFGSTRDVLVRLPVKEGFTSARTSDSVTVSLCAAEGAAAGKPFEAVCPQAVRSYCDRLVHAKESAKRNEIRAAWREVGGPDYDCSTPVAHPDSEAALTVKRTEFVGPQVGRELLENGALALLFVSLGIVGYLWLRFEWKFGVSAIIANLHDVVLILGVFSLFQLEFSLPVLAALLAILGYSVNESVVVMDRIRETFRNRRFRTLSVPQVIDNAITATMSRTIITHGSTQLMVCAMLIFGGEALFYFALALTFGILFGIYSSIFVGSPLLMWLGLKREDLAAPERKAADASV